MDNNIGILDPDGINVNPLTQNPYSDEYKKLAKIWSKFPAYEKAKEIINSININQVVLITSGTGSGKTVLLPKFCLHSLNYDKKIAVTLPKQIIAKSAAEFAAKTLDVKLGEEVGYKYKGSEKSGISEKTKLLFATDGTIVSKLLKDPNLTEYGAVLIDEAHERKVQIDLLLYLLKQTCKMRPEFKLIIMSATVNEEIFKSYFNEFSFMHFDIGGKTNYPIESIFVDHPVDNKSYAEVGIKILQNIINTTTDGDILFFVTSVNETFEACKKINSYDNKQTFCVEVYAGMNQISQELAQDENLYKEKISVDGKFIKNRKIVIATNVAESSLTIANIKYVIDSGYELFGSYDPEKRTRVLEKKLITQAQAKQRMGRAGRTGSGTCYHLYTKDDFINKMEKFPLPAIRVSNIYGECLKLLSLPLIETTDNLKNVLSQFIEPPKETYVDSALVELMQLGLIEKNKITTLGHIIAEMQQDPCICLAIYYGYQLNCAKEVISIFSMIDAMKGNINELFNIPTNIDDDKVNTTNDKNKKLDYMINKFMDAKKSLKSTKGDHLSLLKIFAQYTKVRKDTDKANDWIYKKFLKKGTLDTAIKYFKKIRQNTFQILSKVDKIKIDNIMENNISTRVLTAIYSGYFLNIAFYNDKSYSTNELKNLQISKDSWLYFNDKQKSVVMYYELFTAGGRTDIKIASEVPNKCKKLRECFM